MTESKDCESRGSGGATPRSCSLLLHVLQLSNQMIQVHVVKFWRVYIQLKTQNSSVDCSIKEFDRSIRDYRSIFII